MLIIIKDTKGNKNINRLEAEMQKHNYKVHIFSAIDKIGELSKIMSTQDKELMQEIKNIQDDYNKSIVNQIFSYIDEYDRGKDIFVVKAKDEEGVELVTKNCPDKYIEDILIKDLNKDSLDNLIDYLNYELK